MVDQKIHYTSRDMTGSRINTYNSTGDVIGSTDLYWDMERVLEAAVIITCFYFAVWALTTIINLIIVWRTSMVVSLKIKCFILDHLKKIKNGEEERVEDAEKGEGLVHDEKEQNANVSMENGTKKEGIADDSNVSDADRNTKVAERTTNGDSVKNTTNIVGSPISQIDVSVKPELIEGVYYSE